MHVLSPASFQDKNVGFVPPTMHCGGACIYFKLKWLVSDYKVESRHRSSAFIVETLTIVSKITTFHIWVYSAIYNPIIGVVKVKVDRLAL